MTPLSPRQLDVLRVSAKGLCANEGAERLGIAPDTFRQHRPGAIHRLGAHTKAQAVAIATREGLIR